jgi:hypothetical protein
MDNVAEFIEQIKSNQESFRVRLAKIEDLGVNVSRAVLRDLIQDARELHEGSVVLSYILFKNDSIKKSEQLKISLLENGQEEQLIDRKDSINLTEEEELLDALDEAIESTQIEIKADLIGSTFREESENFEQEFEKTSENYSANSQKEKTPTQEGLTSELENEISSVITSFSSKKEGYSTQEQIDGFEEPKSEVPKSIIDSSSWNSGESEEDNSLAASLAKKRIESLISAIGINEKFLFTNELFDGNTEQFLQVIEDLNDCISLEEAKSKLDAQAQKRNWEQEEDSFQKLQTLVSRKHQ